MKRTLRNSLSFLLVAVLLLSMFSATAVGFNDGNSITSEIKPSVDETDLVPVTPESRKKHVLYTWTASDDLDADKEVFTSNLLDESDASQRWNESAVMYTQREVKQVTLHNFLNKVATVEPGENLKVDLYPQVSTTDLRAVSLSFVYAHKANENDLNPANNGLLRVYASVDGQNWSEGYVGVRSAYILGMGTGENNENIIYYQITTENLMSLDGLDSGDEIAKLRIMPDGESGMYGGTFALCELTVTGYETETAFETNVPAYIRGAVTLDEDTVRESLVDAARSSDAGSSLGRIQAALALVSDTVPDSAQDFWNASGIAVADGIDTKAKDTFLELLSQLLEREGEWKYDTITTTDEETKETTEETVWQEYPLTTEGAEQILADYETIETTSDIVKKLNTPQQILRAYANAKPGDLLLRFTQTEAEIYMITGSEVEFLPDGVNVKFAEENASGNWDYTCSTMTYLDAAGESEKNLFDLFAQEFVPLTVSNLLTWNLDAYASAVNGVKVAVISDRVVDKCEITVGEETVTFSDLNEVAPVCSDPALDAAVVELGEGTHQMTVAVTNDLGTTKTLEVEFEVPGETQLFELYGANITMGNTLDMNFYVDQSNFNGSGYYAVLDGPDRKTVPMAEWGDNNGYYQFTYDGLAAKQMSDEIAVTVYDAQDNQVSEVWTDSMRSYVMRILDKQTEPAAKSLLVDMLYYGAAAQTNFEYNTADLANNQLTAAQQEYATQEIKTCTDGCVKGDNYYGTNFDLKNQISMNLYFVNVTNDMSAKIEFTDHYGKQHTVTVPGSEFSDNGNCKVINVDEIVAADGRQNVTCTVYDADGTTVIASVTDSLESYVARMYEDYPWLGEIMKFSDAAYAYLHRNDT